MSSLGLLCESGGMTHLVRTGDDFRKLALLLLLALDHGFQDAGMVRAKVDEAVGDAGLD